MAEGLIWERQGEAVQSNTHKSGTALVILILSILIQIWHCEEQGHCYRIGSLLNVFLLSAHEERNEPWSLGAVRKDYERFAGEVRGPSSLARMKNILTAKNFLQGCHLI
jgi:hypothetical protein